MKQYSISSLLNPIQEYTWSSQQVPHIHEPKLVYPSISPSQTGFLPFQLYQSTQLHESSFSLSSSSPPRLPTSSSSSPSPIMSHFVPYSPHSTPKQFRHYDEQLSEPISDPDETASEPSSSPKLSPTSSPTFIPIIVQKPTQKSTLRIPKKKEKVRRIRVIDQTKQINYWGALKRHGRICNTLREDVLLAEYQSIVKSARH